MQGTSFAQRFGFETSRPIHNNFPDSAREALIFLFRDLYRDKRFLPYPEQIVREVERLTRGEHPKRNWRDFPFDDWSLLEKAIRSMEWLHVFMLCERVYEKFLGYYDEYRRYSDNVDWQTVSDYFSRELNNLLIEENLAYEFENGYFQRRGRAQTQKSIQRMGKVLTDPRLSTARIHHAKALQFFTRFPEPDAQNCVKENLCVLEAALDSLTGQQISSDFAKSLRRLIGNNVGQIPAPIAEGMIKLHAYRGSGQGVSHASERGTRVTEFEAELAMNLVAAYVTYLVDLYPYDELDY